MILLFTVSLLKRRGAFKQRLFCCNTGSVGYIRELIITYLYQKVVEKQKSVAIFTLFYLTLKLKKISKSEIQIWARGTTQTRKKKKNTNSFTDLPASKRGPKIN